MVVKDLTGCQAHIIYISHGKETALHGLICIVWSKLLRTKQSCYTYFIIAVLNIIMDGKCNKVNDSIKP